MLRRRIWNDILKTKNSIEVVLGVLFPTFYTSG